MRLLDTPSTSVSVVVDNEDVSVVRVYSFGCPMEWCIHISLFYKAATPYHFMPPEAAPLSHPMLSLSIVSAEV